MQAVTRPRAQGYGCLIGSDYFRLAPSTAAPIITRTQDSLAARQDDKGLAGENVLELGYAFGRQNLTGGEGLDWWPRPAGEVGVETDIIRFWDSANIDIRRPDAGDPYEAVLSKIMESFWTPTSAPKDMGSSHDAVYIAEGANVHRFDDWGDTTPDDTDTPGGTIVMLDVGHDDTVIVVDGNGDIYMKPDNADAYVKVYDSTTDGGNVQAAWWVKGRIIAARRQSTTATAGEVLEISPGIAGVVATPTSDSLVTLIDTFTGTLNAIVDGGHAIVGVFSDGSIRSYVPQADSAGSVPLLTVRARSNVPKGENPYALAWSLGVLLVFTLEEGTSKTARLYSASVLDERFDFAVASLQLLREWQGVTEAAPDYTKRIATVRDEAFFAMDEGTNNCNIWRYDFVTQGLFRHIKSELVNSRGLTVFDDRIALCEVSSVYLQSATDYEPEGYLITPNVTFGLNTPISWTAFVVEVFGLETQGVRVEVYQTSDPEAIKDPASSSWVLVQAITDPSQSGLELSTVNIEGNQLALMVKWYASTAGTASPNVARFAVRGLPQHRDWVVEVPVNVADVISAPGRMPIRVPGLGDQVHASLVALQGKAKTFHLYDPPLVLRGIVEGIAEPVTYLSDRGSQGRYCMVRFLGNLVGTATLSETNGNAGMGVAQAGVATMGIGEVL